MARAFSGATVAQVSFEESLVEAGPDLDGISAMPTMR
jgi:hypothetical protein